MEKFLFLNGVKERDSQTFYRILIQNMAEVIPILYTPTVGEVCQQYSAIWRRPEGLYISWNDRGNVRQVLESWPERKSARIAVVTDGSRILGLGDLGANGLPISLGKLDLYIAGAGINPEMTFPICLDMGTNNEKLLKDPLYLGLRQKRPSDPEALEFVKEFMQGIQQVCPELVVQFEDFATTRAFQYLATFRNDYRCFNDDIQGTGAVVLSGFLNAARIASSSSPSSPDLLEHRILFYGAGSAGIGVAKMLMSYYDRIADELGVERLSEDEKRKRIWTVDSRGLIALNRPGKLDEHKRYFARDDYTGSKPLKDLVEIIRYVRPTALIGLSAMRNAFSKEVVEAMSDLNHRPIVFPLSNPLSTCELDFGDALEWSGGRVIYSSGSPYDPITFRGQLRIPSQGNNMYQFPGIGFGILISKARIVTDTMVEAAAFALADSLTEAEKADGLLYPRLERIREVSSIIAVAVIRTAEQDNVIETDETRKLDDEALKSRIRSSMWLPAARDSSNL